MHDVVIIISRFCKETPNALDRGVYGGKGQTLTIIA